MNKTAHEIEALKTALNLNQTDLAKLTGVDVATFSRLRTGDGARQISFNDLERVRRVVPVEWAARLLRARLLDQNTGPGSKLIQILLRDESDLPAELKETGTEYGRNLGPDLDRAMRRLGSAAKDDSKLRSVLLFLARQLPES
jgi:transcriptional regulator with XRE-family HTH domain